MLDGRVNQFVGTDHTAGENDARSQHQQHGQKASGRGANVLVVGLCHDAHPLTFCSLGVLYRQCDPSRMCGTTTVLTLPLSVFSLLLAGGGFKAGHVHGTTDEVGYRAVEGRVSVNDLHATLLHQLGLDHNKLTFVHHGRPETLTDSVITNARVVTDLMV